jgi:2-keto-4-pentenoate hydratase/2-oxohepta-3-ene-1,7-dioic acid hydratase in catechol pathway
MTIPLPAEKPRNIICVGLNYRRHAEESGVPIPPNPILFAKFSNSIIGPDDEIKLPSFTSQVDYEAELGVVIGKRASGVSVADALDYVLGYTCVNDVSARDVQFADSQWVRGKAFDTFCPWGPHIATTDEITDPQKLGIRCRVNGETLQDSNTADMIFGVAEIVSFISQAITLEPGDLIATGTPEGVGFARTPPIYLKPGDVVEIEIDGIGTLSNPVASR